MLTVICILQSAKAAAAAGMPWAADDIATLVHGGLGTFRLAHAESAAQQASAAPGLRQRSQMHAGRMKCDNWAPAFCRALSLTC